MLNPSDHGGPLHPCHAHPARPFCHTDSDSDDREASPVEGRFPVGIGSSAAPSVAFARQTRVVCKQARNEYTLRGFLFPRAAARYRWDRRFLPIPNTLELLSFNVSVTRLKLRSRCTRLLANCRHCHMGPFSIRLCVRAIRSAPINIWRPYRPREYGHRIDLGTINRNVACMLGSTPWCSKEWQAAKALSTRRLRASVIDISVIASLRDAQHE